MKNTVIGFFTLHFIKVIHKIFHFTIWFILLFIGVKLFYVHKESFEPKKTSKISNTILKLIQFILVLNIPLTY